MHVCACKYMYLHVNACKNPPAPPPPPGVLGGARVPRIGKSGWGNHIVKIHDIFKIAVVRNASIYVNTCKYMHLHVSVCNYLYLHGNTCKSMYLHVFTCEYM